MALSLQARHGKALALAYEGLALAARAGDRMGARELNVDLASALVAVGRWDDVAAFPERFGAATAKVQPLLVAVHQARGRHCGGPRCDRRDCGRPGRQLLVSHPQTDRSRPRGACPRRRRRGGHPAAGGTRRLRAVDHARPGVRRAARGGRRRRPPGCGCARCWPKRGSSSWGSAQRRGSRHPVHPRAKRVCQTTSDSASARSSS